LTPLISIDLSYESGCSAFAASSCARNPQSLYAGLVAAAQSRRFAASHCRPRPRSTLAAQIYGIAAFNSREFAGGVIVLESVPRRGRAVASDPDGTIAKSYDLKVMEKKPGAKDTRGMEIDHAFTERTTFVIAPDSKSDVNQPSASRHNPGPHAGVSCWVSWTCPL
jgi:hypothetical protein